MGLWFAVFPTVETLVAQALAVFLVLGSYVTVRLRDRPRAQAPETASVSAESGRHQAGRRSEAVTRNA